MQFAPTTHVALAELDKVNGAIEFILPIAHDLRLSRVDLDKRERLVQALVDTVVATVRLMLHRISLSLKMNLDR